jgi:hypothetical protein
MSIQFGSSLSLNEFANAVATVGQDVTIIGQGEPGIGKSSMLKVLAQRLPHYETAYIDCTLLDLGDFALPYTELASTQRPNLKVTQFAPNARFKFQSDKPVIIMLDEIGKAMKAVKNVLLTLMLEKRIGDVKLPEGSIVFGTTNLATDGVGDSLEAHARNRVCFVTVRKPSAGFTADGSVESDSWGAWALENDIAPEIIAWVKQFPHALESYTDKAQKDNPYIFNPTRAGQSAFVTPRSLEKASHIAKKRAILGDSVTISACQALSVSQLVVICKRSSQWWTSYLHGKLLLRILIKLKSLMMRSLNVSWCSLRLLVWIRTLYLSGLSMQTS